MNIQLALNLLALVLSVTGTLLMYRFTPKVSSQTYIYSRAEQEGNRKKDAQKQAMISRGMILLLIACVVQAIALTLPVKP